MSSQSDFNKDLKSGFFFGFIERYSNLIVQFLVMMFLARFISPAAFGVIATVMVVIFFFNLIGEMGFGPAIIYHKELSLQEIRGIFLICVIIGAVLYAILAFSANQVADFFNNEIYINIMPLLGIMVFFSCASIVPETLLRRDKKFRLIAIVTFSVAVISGVLACILAYIGYGVYSLVWKAILFSGVRFFIVFAFFGRKFLLGSVSFHGVKKVFGFSSYQFLFNCMYYFSRNSDKFLISKFMGETAVGFYDMAYRLMLLPVQNLSGVASGALQPVYSNNKLEDIVVSYNTVLKYLLFAGIFIFLTIIFFSEDIIYIIYGPGWELSAEILRLLSGFIIFQIILSTTGAVWQAMGMARSLFYCGLFASIVNVSAISVGVYLHDLNWIAFLLSSSSILSFIQCFWLFNKKSSAFHPMVVFKGFIGIIVLFIIVLLVMFLFKNLFIDMVFSQFSDGYVKHISTLFLGVGVQLLATLLLGILIKNELVTTFSNKIFSKLKAKL
ncbi:lipopolysaccharide biosynthesis protein [Phytohalomonas tamaricis]|uniref:lipopolysaccharide biosynthesis protein n=1 Tax=Phytohalomonas tamaricis TaxID=2081032 RepID=UPI000D0B60C3|nr:lipopolysaccharide biosynthesis protein [Phytohalomonas tamaricis]